MSGRGLRITDKNTRDALDTEMAELLQTRRAVNQRIATIKALRKALIVQPETTHQRVAEAYLSAGVRRLPTSMAVAMDLDLISRSKSEEAALAAARQMVYRARVAGFLPAVDTTRPRLDPAPPEPTIPGGFS